MRFIAAAPVGDETVKYALVTASEAFNSSLKFIITVLDPASATAERTVGKVTSAVAVHFVAFVTLVPPAVVTLTS